MGEKKGPFKNPIGAGPVKEKKKRGIPSLEKEKGRRVPYVNSTTCTLLIVERRVYTTGMADRPPKRTKSGGKRVTNAQNHTV